MRRNRGGYTIIEVLIVLAISGVLFTSAVLVFQGQQAKTEFSQSLYDLASSIQSYAIQAGSGAYDNGGTYNCSAPDGGTPVLSTTLPSNDGCLYLGKAIQIVQSPADSQTMNIYTVLGSRLDSSHNPVTQLSDTTPSPAIDDTGAWVLKDTYSLPYSQQFSASKVKPLSSSVFTSAYLVGLYIDLTGATTVGGNTALSVRGYPLTGNASQANLKSCINQAGSCSTPVNVHIWRLCISQGSQVGSVDVTANAGGLTTSVNAQGCA